MLPPYMHGFASTFAIVPDTSAWLHFGTVKAKGIQHLYSATSHKPQPQRRFCVTDKEGLQPIGRRLSLRPEILSYDQTATRSPVLQLNGLHPCNPFNYMGYYSVTGPEGIKAELTWLVDP